MLTRHQQQGFPLPSRRRVCLESEWNFLEEVLSSWAAVVVVVVTAVAAGVLGFAAAEAVPSASGGGLSALCSGSVDAPHEPIIKRKIRE